MLDTKKTKKQIIKYFIISIFFLLLGYIYELYSHGVYSYYMIYAFLIPLLMGFIPYLIIYIKRFNRNLSELGMRIYNCFILTLTLGCTMKGFLEIYGTTNSLVFIYLKVSIILIIISLIINIIFNFRKNEINK